MSAETSNLSHIQDEDVLRKMWQDTDDFGKKKEIRSHMYKLREQRLREFYNGNEITESRSSTTTGKVTKTSTHADSLVDQSFQSLKSKEVRDSESPTRDMHYKVPARMDTNEWQVSSNNERSVDGKTRIHSTVAVAQGTQKIDGGQIDFKARNEKMSSVYQDANENSVTNRSQSCSQSSTATRMVSSSNIPPETIELPSNMQGVTKVIRETKTLPDGTTVTTTKYDTTSGSSQVTSQTGQVKTSQTSSNRQFHEKASSHTVSVDNKAIEIPSDLQEVTKVTRETKTLPDGSTITSTRYDTVSGAVQNTQTEQIKTAHTSSSSRYISENEASPVQPEIPNNLQGVTKITKETKTLQDGSKVTTTKYDTVSNVQDSQMNQTNAQTSSTSRHTNVRESSLNTQIQPELPNNLQGVTKVTKETKTLPDGSIVTTTKYDTVSGTTTHTEVTGNVKISKDHSSVTNRATKYTEEASTTENQQNYRQKDIERRTRDDQRYTTDNKTTIITDKRDTQNINDTNTKIVKEHLESTNLKKINVDKNDENNVSHTVSSKQIPSRQPVGFTPETSVENITITRQDRTEKVHADNFINTERQHEIVTRDKNIQEVTSAKNKDTPSNQGPRERSPTKPTQCEYKPTKPTDGQYETTYRTDFTSKRISVEVSPTHEAFARSLRSVSPDRIPSRGSHRTSNSSLPEKMRHPSRISPERHPKDRSGSPTKSERFSSTDTYIYNKRRNTDNEPNRKSPSPKRYGSSDTFKKTTSQETITISTTSKSDITNKTTKKKDVTRTSNQYLPRSRSPSPTKPKEYLRKIDDIVTDLDEDITITVQKQKSTSRPTSLELARKPKKITDRSPSSPLTDLGSPKKSPSKEIRRSSSFRSPTKEPSSPTKYPTDNIRSPKEASPKSPTKSKPSKILPEDRPFKRTDTYEERCRQILGITEVTDKRKSSLDRSLSKRNSFRRNISSQNVDINDTTNTNKSSLKERPLSPTKGDKTSPVKETPSSKPYDVQKTTVTNETKLSSPVKEKPSTQIYDTVNIETKTTKTTTSTTEENINNSNTDITFREDVTNQSIKSRPANDLPKKSPSSQIPSTNKSPTRVSQQTISEIVDVTTQNNNLITKSKNVPTDKPKKSSISEYPSQKKSIGKDNYRTVTNTENTTVETISQNNITSEENIYIQENIIADELLEISNKEYIKDSSKNDKPHKTGPSIMEYPPQIRSPTKESPRLIPDVAKSDKPLKKSSDVPKEDKPAKKSPTITEFPSQIKSPTKEGPKSVTDVPEDGKPTKKGPTITEFPSQIKSPNKESPKSVTNVPKDDKPTKKGPSITEFPSQIISPTKDCSNTVTDKHKTTTTEFITQEKIHTDIHSSTEAIVDETERNTSPLFEPKKPESRPSSQELLKTKTDKVTKSILQERIITTDDSHTERIVDTENVETSRPKSTKPKSPQDKPVKQIPTEYSSQIQSPNSEVTIITQNTEIVTKKEDIKNAVPQNKEPTKKGKTITEFPSQIRKEPKTVTNKPEGKLDNKISNKNVTDINSTNTFEDTIIDELIVTDDSNVPKITIGTPITIPDKPTKKSTEHPSRTRSPTKETTDINKVTTSTVVTSDDSLTKEDDTVVVTDEFEIVNISKQKPSPTKKAPGIAEFPSQVRQPNNKNIPQEKLSPKKEKPLKEKPQLSEYPSQIKRDKKPKIKEVPAIEKHIEPISYEGRVPVEEPLMVKKHMYTHCREDEVRESTAFIDKERKEVNEDENIRRKTDRPTNKETTTTKNKVSTLVKKIQKQPSIDQPDKKHLTKKPINGITEYKDQYSKPKPKELPTRPSSKNITDETQKVFKLSNKINSIPTKPITKVAVNGFHKPDKVKETQETVKSSTVTISSAKIPKQQPTTDTFTKKTTKTTILKDNETPDLKPKRGPIERIVKSPVKTPSSGTRAKPVQPEQLTTKKHLVTTTITLKSNNQSNSTKPKVTKTTKVAKSEKNRVTDLKQKHNNEYVSTDTDEDESVVENITETLEVTRRNLNKKPEKKCITTKTVIINNNETDQRQIIVDLQRSKSSREPTPDKICPVPTDNGGYESPRYPDEIIEPDDDVIRSKPKRLSDIPIIESEDVSNFSRIKEIIDVKTVSEIDKVEETDESLLSVNKKINLFLDTADKLNQGNKKSSGPAPKVSRPKLEVTEDLKSDECLLSVSQKVNKFVNAADQFVNIHDLPERPKSPRCKFNDDKITSNTFITTEQTTLEKQNVDIETRKISLENLNIEHTKKPSDRKNPRTTSPENTRGSKSVDRPDTINRKPNRTTSPDFVKVETLDKPGQTYPNYNTITKRVSLENLEIKGSAKPTSSIRKPSPEQTTTSTRTTEYRVVSRDISPEDKRYKPGERTSPDRKSPARASPLPSETPNRRPSNEYTSINTIKTQEIKSTKRDISTKTDTTPKSSKSKPIEDKRNILSTTGRLRSTESIKKAKALFENIAKDQQQTRPNTKSPVYNKSQVTQVKKETVSRKLSYSSDDDSKLKKNTRSRSTSPGKQSPRTHSPGTHPNSSSVPHYMLPLDRDTEVSRSWFKSPENDIPQHASPGSYHQTSDTPHYMLSLDRSIDDNKPWSKSPERGSYRSTSPEPHYGTSDIPHYMLPLDRTTEVTKPSSKFPEREGIRHSSPGTYSGLSEVPHYMLPLEKNPETLKPLSKTPEKDSPRPYSPSPYSETSDTPHYMLPLDRDTRISRPRSRTPEKANLRSGSPVVRPEIEEVPHYMLPLDRNVRVSRPRSRSSGRDSPRTSSPEVRSETGDIPHYMLPLDRSVHPHSPQRDHLTSGTDIESRTTKFGVTLKKVHPESPSKTIPKSTISKSTVERKISNIDSLTEEDIEDIFELEILEEILHKITSYELRRVIRTQIRLVKKLISENTLEIYIKERRQSKIKKNRSDSLTKKTSEYHTTETYNERRRSSERVTDSKSQSPQRVPSENTYETITKTHTRNTYTSSKNNAPKEITRRPDEIRRTSPQRTPNSTKPSSDTTSTFTRKLSPERTSYKVSTTTTTRQYSPSGQQSPPRQSSPNRAESITSNTKTTYTITSSSEVPTSGTLNRKTEELRRLSPERNIKSTVIESSSKTEQIRKSSMDKTSITTTRTETRSPERNVPHKKTPSRPSPDRSTNKPESKTSYSILKKTETTQKKVEDNKPEWVTKRNLKKVTPQTTNEKITSSRKTVKKEKIVTSSECQPTDLITSSYGVGPTDENGTPLFGLKALRTQNNYNDTTKVQGTFIKSEYYSENGQEPVGQITVTKYSTDPRDLSTDEQIENNKLVTSVTTTQKFGYEDTPSLEALTNKKMDRQIEDSVESSNRTSNFQRQNSVKALSQKFIDTAVESLKNERQTSYPKAGLILRTSSFKDSKNASNEEDTSGVITTTKTSKHTTTTKTSGGSFLTNKSSISGVTDVISRMKTEDYQEGDTSEDIEARSLLNKFIGSQVLLSGMENRGTSITTSKSLISDIVPTTSTSVRRTIRITINATEDGKTKTKTLVFQSPITEEELENIWDEQTLRLLLEQSTEYEERRIIRNRLRRVMAEQEACAELVEKASQEQSSGKIEEKASIEKSTSESPTTTTTKVTKVSTQQQIIKKPLSPFAKFRQLDKQNSSNTPPGTPGTPGTPKTPGTGPLFKFTDPAVSLSAATIKDRLLFWCKMKTKEYENVQLDNFSTSWADGLAFCALIHHFLPDAFDYHALTPKERRHNFELAFRVASDKADIFPLLDVDDMMATRKPDWKCVFTYVQSIYRRFKDEEI